MLLCKSVSEVHNDDTQQSCLSVCQKIYFTLLQWFFPDFFITKILMTFWFKITSPPPPHNTQKKPNCNKITNFFIIKKFYTNNNGNNNNNNNNSNNTLEIIL
jgi:hypothetical protein